MWNRTSSAVYALVYLTGRGKVSLHSILTRLPGRVLFFSSGASWLTLALYHTASFVLHDPRDCCDVSNVQNPMMDMDGIRLFPLGSVRVHELINIVVPMPNEYLADRIRIYSFSVSAYTTRCSLQYKRHAYWYWKIRSPSQFKFQVLISAEALLTSFGRIRLEQFAIIFGDIEERYTIAMSNLTSLATYLRRRVGAALACACRCMCKSNISYPLLFHRHHSAYLTPCSVSLVAGAVPHLHLIDKLPERNLSHGVGPWCRTCKFQERHKLGSFFLATELAAELNSCLLSYQTYSFLSVAV